MKLGTPSLAVLALLAASGGVLAGGVSNPTGTGGSGNVSCGTAITGCPSGPLTSTVTLNAQNGTSYTPVSSDSAKTITLTNGSTITLSPPVATGAGFTAGFAFDAEDTGTGCTNITPTTSTISTLATVQICQGQGAFVFSDSNNYWADVTLPLAANNTVMMNGSGSTNYPVAVATTGTGSPVLSASPTFTGTVGAAAITETGIYTNSLAGAVSQNSFTITGAPVTGGTGTTTFPLINIGSGAAATTYNTSGTYLSFNTASGFAGDVIVTRTNGGASQFRVQSNGGIITSGPVTFNNGLAVTGAASSINASSNFATNINTGTSTGAVNIGNSGTTGVTSILGISTGTNADFLCLSGTGIILLQTSACTISSIRFKDVRGPYRGDALKGLLALPIDNWTYKRSMGKNRDRNTYTLQTGLIAEDVAKQFPLCAIYESDMKTIKSYRETCVIAMLVRAIQQLQGEVNDLRRRH